MRSLHHENRDFGILYDLMRLDFDLIYNRRIDCGKAGRKAGHDRVDPTKRRHGVKRPIELEPPCGIFPQRPRLLILQDKARREESKSAAVRPFHRRRLSI